MKSHTARKKDIRELGFGNKNYDSRNRAINRDGTFNRIRTGEGFFDSFDLYHWLVKVKWFHFLGVVFIWYFTINLIFALLYFWAGPEGIGGILGESKEEQFWEVFFFSSQTLTTLGYGRMAPVSHIISAIAAVESMIGLMGFALITGLLYGRFSKPSEKFIYSSHAIIAPYKNTTALMFRIANKKSGNLLDPAAEMVLSMQNEETKTRIYESLPLERSTINFLALSWTIVHPIDQESPLFGMTKEEFMKSDAEIIIIMKAFDETFAETIYSRTSYTPDEVIWGAKFLPMIGTDKNGNRVLQMNQLDAFELTSLPQHFRVAN